MTPCVSRHACWTGPKVASAATALDACRCDRKSRLRVLCACVVRPTMCSIATARSRQDRLPVGRPGRQGDALTIADVQQLHRRQQSHRRDGARPVEDLERVRSIAANRHASHVLHGDSHRRGPVPHLPSPIDDCRRHGGTTRVHHFYQARRRAGRGSRQRLRQRENSHSSREDFLGSACWCRAGAKALPFRRFARPSLPNSVRDAVCSLWVIP